MLQFEKERHTLLCILKLFTNIIHQLSLKMHGYPQFSFWISVVLIKIYISCIIINRGKNTFELVSTVLKIANIDTLYDRHEWLSLKIFNEISHTNDHKLASLLPPRAKCRKLRNKGTFDIPSLLLSAIFIELVYFQFFKCLLIFSINSFICFYISIILNYFIHR